MAVAQQKKARQGNIYISLGGAGNAILHSIQQETGLCDQPAKQAAFINFSSSDLSSKYVGAKLLLGDDGTGRDQNVGSELVRAHSEKIVKWVKQFVIDNQGVMQEGGSVVILSSFGGGTGASLMPTVIDAVHNAGYGHRTVLVGVLSSPREGVATGPNSVKAFQRIYNDYVLTDKVKCSLLFDNEKFEKSFELNTYDFGSMNSLIVAFLQEFFDEDVYRRSATGFQTLDVNEVRRVVRWGKGLADYSMSEKAIDGDTELKYDSSIFGGKYKLSSAKACALLVKFKKGEGEYDQKTLDFVSESITNFKKKVSSAFFVFGYSFGNKEQDSDLEFHVILNGLDWPHTFNSDVKRAVKAVGKVKKANTTFDMEQGTDLDF